MKKGVKFGSTYNKQQQNLINQTSVMLTDLKKQDGFAFQRDVDSIAPQQFLVDLEYGFRNFFEKHAIYPQFKSKHNNR